MAGYGRLQAPIPVFAVRYLAVVDKPALLDVLQARKIKGAGLDVFRNEPNIDPRFLGLDNEILQPHHASGTVETRKAMGKLVRDILEAHFAGSPLLTQVP